MKNDKDISRFLSLVLRHEPEKIGITLDPHGWVSIETLLAALPFPLDRARLDGLIRDNDKQRFAISSDGTKIRANQGHSVSVDLGLATSDPPEFLYHGTVEKFLPSILAQGLVKGDRHHVHLSANIETAQKVGDRRGSAIILVVAAQQMVADGHRFFVSENGVWLTDHVPASYLTRLPPKA
jgi:putative RNA 2'-phosphotransferase